MRRRSLPLFAALLAAATACGPAEVVVTVELDLPNPDGEGTVVRPIDGLEVRLIPFDRDQVFDSMTAAFGTPEPPIPPELAAARDEVRAARENWQQLQTRWGTLRDTLQKITDAMEGYSRGEAAYVALFREFQDFDAEYGQVERRVDQAFQTFTDLQQGTIRASDSIRILQDNWADEAFADYFLVFDAKQSASGLSAVTDTTDANGVARQNLLVKPGQYWVVAFYEQAYSELYWNVPITVEGGDPTTITLSRSNATERPIL